MYKSFLLIHSLVLGDSKDKLTEEEEEYVIGELKKNYDSTEMRQT